MVANHSTQAPEPKRYLITGGAGFVGSHLTERLLQDGQMVTVIDDLSTGALGNLARVANHPNLRIITATVSGCEQLPALAKEADFIFHLAAAVGVDLVVSSPIRTIETNLMETRAVLEAASLVGTPVLITSTSEVYGKSAKPEFHENDDLIIGPPTLGRWSYACSKLMDEFLALAHAQERGLPVLIARLFNTVGPRQTGRYGMVLPRFIQQAREGSPLRVFGDGTQTRCFCLVHDTVEALVRLSLCTKGPERIFNIGSTEEVSIGNLALRVIERLSSSSCIEFVPYAQAYAPGFEDMQRRKPSVDRLAAVTGFKPTTRLDAIIDSTLRG